MLFRSKDRENLSDEFIKDTAANALVIVEEMRAGIEAGRKQKIMPALTICLSSFAEVPGWLSDAILAAFTKVESGKVNSWDDVFGAPLKKGQHASARRKRKEKEPLVTVDIQKLILEQGRALDESLFEDVGRKHGLGKTLTADYYYAFKKRQDRGRAATARQHPEWELGPHTDESLMHAAIIESLVYGKP